MAVMSRAPSAAVALTICLGLLSTLAVQASPTCPEQQTTPQVPTNLALCKQLEPTIRNPGAIPLNDYEKALNQFMSNMCHRNTAGGWVSDKRIRDTGPWVGTYANGAWSGQYYGTHSPVLIWYSPDFYAWLKANRPENPAPRVEQITEQPVPDGAIVVKEMYTYPGAACSGVDPLYLLPTVDGAAVMVRDSTVAHDGWFWGWYGWPGSVWQVDWPAKDTSPTPNMGFGQYCTNCHASAKENQTFAALKNIKGEPGQPLVFLSQNFFLKPPMQSQLAGAVAAAAPPPAVLFKPLHVRIAEFAAKAAPPSTGPANPFFIATAPHAAAAAAAATAAAAAPTMKMPPMTYDNVWVKAGTLTAASQFITSDQCVGCHSAGGTGLQYDMTQPGTASLLLNISPYGTWRGSPMGLAGRDPIFFAQLSSETEKFHHDLSSAVQDTCLGCHGILGQRQFGIDMPRLTTGQCAPFARDTVDVTPFPPNDPVAKLAHYGGLARDGISCAACHHMVLGNKELGAGGEPAAERLRAAAPGRFESGLQRLRQNLHRQFLGRSDRPLLRAVRRPEDQADESRARRRSRT